MSSFWDVPAILIMAFSLALDAPAGKASRIPPQSPPPAITVLDRAREPALREALSDDAWLRALKRAAPASDALSRYAARIFVTSAGRYYVPVPSEKAEILALRSNGDVAVRVLAAATAELKRDLHETTGREPSRGALLVAHLLGRSEAISYMRAAIHEPSARAVRVVPAFGVLLNGDGSLTVGALDRRLSHALGGPVTEVADAGRGRGTREAFKGTLTRPEALSRSEVASAR